MQEMQRSACAVFGREGAKTKTKDTKKPNNNNKENTGQETLENTLECTCMGETESETDVGQ